MVVTSESGGDPVTVETEVPAELPSEPSSPTDVAHVKDALKKGSKRIFPLYDNFSKSVKRHREKSREREKSRDRVKQRDRLKLKEEEGGLSGKTVDNAEVEKANKSHKEVEEERGRDKTKEKKRFYLRDKSKDKKKNKDKNRNSKTGEDNALELRGNEVVSTGCRSSKEEQIYGETVKLSRTVSSNSKDSRNSNSKDNRRPALHPSNSTPSMCQYNERAIDVPFQSSPTSADSSTPSPLPSVQSNDLHGTCSNTLPGSRQGLYESPLGKYGSPGARYFTLENYGERRPSEHYYESFANVLQEATAGKSTDTAKTASSHSKAVGSNAAAVEDQIAPTPDSVSYASIAPLISSSAKQNRTSWESQQRDSHDSVESSGGGTGSAAAGDAPGPQSDRPDRQPPSPDPSVTDRRRVDPVQCCATSAENQSTLRLSQGADSAPLPVSADGSDRVVSEPSAVRGPHTSVARTPALAADAPPFRETKTQTATQGATDKCKGSRKFLTLNNTRVKSESGAKASAKRSFLSTLLRPESSAIEGVTGKPVAQSEKVKSLPAKYRDLFRERDKKSVFLEQPDCSRAVSVSEDLETRSVQRENKVNDPFKCNKSEIVEIELPGVFGQSQMRASLRITLKNEPNQPACDAKDVRSASTGKCETSVRRSQRDSASTRGKPVTRRPSRSRSRSQTRRNAEQRMSITIPPATVAALTNKFNALIQATSTDSSPSPTSTKTFNLGSIAVDKSGNVSKSSSFRRADGVRNSARRRVCVARTDKRSMESTEALVNRASDVLSREIASLLRARSVSGGDASPPSSGPTSLRMSRGGEARLPASGPGSDSVAPPRTPSFRRTRLAGSTSRDSGRLSSRRRNGDTRNSSNRKLAWTPAVRVEQKKVSSPQLSPALNQRQNTCNQADNLSRRIAASAVQKDTKASLKSEVSTINLVVESPAKAKESAKVLLSTRRQPISPSNELKKSVSTSMTLPSSVKLSDWTTKSTVGDARSKLTSEPMVNKQKRLSMDPSRVYDRELRKITNTGTVARASELWLKRAQSTADVDTFKRKSATLQPVSQSKAAADRDGLTIRDITMIRDSKEEVKSTEKTTSLSTSKRGNELPSSDSKDIVPSHKSRQESSSLLKATSNQTSSFPQVTDEAICRLEQGKSQESSVCKNRSLHSTKINVLDNRIYGCPTVRGFQRNTRSTLFENKLYGTAFTPVKDVISKYAAVTSQTTGKPSGTQTLNRTSHSGASRSLSVKSLPSESPGNRVKEAIHRLEMPSSQKSDLPKAASTEHSWKSTTLPTRLPTAASTPSGVRTPVTGCHDTARVSNERSRGLYESIWNSKREYKPNESFLWHGCSQMNSGGESVTSSFSCSDRDTASSLSDASSATEEDAAARGRGTLWRRLATLARAAPPAELPPSAGADYEPTGGSSSSGTVTYENGSDPGYERISGDSCGGYEQIGASNMSTASSRYERIGAPPLPPPAPPSETTTAGYETLAPPSEASTLCYDECVVPARLAVVSEHQTESIGYLDSGSAQYEDIGGAWTSRAVGDGAASRPTPLQTCQEHDETECSSECGPQTVNSYQLTDFRAVCDGGAQVAAPSLPSTPRAAASDRDTAGEWTDIDADGEQENSDDATGAESPIVVTRPHFVRLRNRSRRFSKTRAGRRSWSQSLRNLHHLTAEQERLQREGPWRHTTASGVETDEEWQEDGRDEEEESHLYEALDPPQEHDDVVPEAVDSEDGEDDEKKLGGEIVDADQHRNGMQKIANGMRKRLQKTKSGIRFGIIRFRKSSSLGADGSVSTLSKGRGKRGSSGASLSSPGADTSKFYLDLDLVLQPDRRLGEPREPREPREPAAPAAVESADAPSESEPGSNRSSVRRSETGSLSSLSSVQQQDGRVRLPSTQSSSSHASSASAAAAGAGARRSGRPTISPPAPPAPLAADTANASPPLHDSGVSVGFARSLSASAAAPDRSLSAAFDGQVSAPPIPPPAARAPSASAETRRSSADRPWLERGATVGADDLTSPGLDNTEYMLATEPEPVPPEEEEDMYISLRDREPLYQLRPCYQESVDGGSEDDYETIREDQLDAGASEAAAPASPGREEAARSPPPPLPPPPPARRLTSSCSALQLGAAAGAGGGHRSLWREQPEVIASGLLDTMSKDQTRLQEAKFEVVSSEASYQKSLSVLVTHFQQSPALGQFQLPDSVPNRTDLQVLFSNASKVRQCSESFLAELEQIWQSNITLDGICDVIHRHAHQHFHVYKKYCANQILQARKLKELRERSPAFQEVLSRLESWEGCQSQKLYSFLMLPMQRVTRLKLLVEAVLKKLEPQDAEYQSCQRAYDTVAKLANDCNESARHYERMEEMVAIYKTLDFRDLKKIGLVSENRWLVKRGDLERTMCKADDSKVTFGRKQTRQQTVHVFLFTDLLLISKKKSDDSFVVLDYCERNKIDVEDRGDRFLLTLLNNHEGKTVEMLLGCREESQRVRWLQVVSPKTQSSAHETVYEAWDCPQVQAVHSYAAQQPDELSLQPGDVLKVLKKLPDGWYQGMRVVDAASGWFPSDNCVEISSEHVRARHLRQRYQVLRIAGNHLQQVAGAANR